MSQQAGDWWLNPPYFINGPQTYGCWNYIVQTYQPILPIQSYTIPQMLKIKKLTESAQLPSKSRDSDEGYDLYCLEDFILSSNETRKVKTGICLGLPDGYWAKIEARSGLASQGITVEGGVIDHEYTGEIIVCLHNNNNFMEKTFNAGDKIAQLVLHKHRHFDIVEVESLEDTSRGDKGFGSSGN